MAAAGRPAGPPGSFPGCGPAVLDAVAGLLDQLSAGCCGLDHAPVCGEGFSQSNHPRPARSSVVRAGLAPRPMRAWGTQFPQIRRPDTGSSTA